MFPAVTIGIVVGDGLIRSFVVIGGILRSFRLLA